MHYNLSKPCANCPFRNDIPGYLARERVIEIAESVLNQQSFPCHKTTVEDDGDEAVGELVSTADSEQCAGAEIFAAFHGRSSQMARIAERLGLPVARLDMTSPVCRSVTEMKKVHSRKRAKTPA